jgi:hypothetical protein
MLPALRGYGCSQFVLIRCPFSPGFKYAKMAFARGVPSLKRNWTHGGTAEKQAERQRSKAGEQREEKVGSCSCHDKSLKSVRNNVQETLSNEIHSE